MHVRHVYIYNKDRLLVVELCSHSNMHVRHVYIYNKDRLLVVELCGHSHMLVTCTLYATKIACL